MSLLPAAVVSFTHNRSKRARTVRALSLLPVLAGMAAWAACGGAGEGEIITPPEVGVIRIDTGSFAIERGTQVTLMLRCWTSTGSHSTCPWFGAARMRKPPASSPGAY